MPPQNPTPAVKALRDINLPMPPGGVPDPVLIQPGMGQDDIDVRMGDPEYRKRAGLSGEGVGTSSGGTLFRYMQDKRDAGYPEQSTMLPKSTVPTYNDPFEAALAGLNVPGISSSYLKKR